MIEKDKMLPKYVAILKANSGELEALGNLDRATARKLIPMFEVGRPPDATRQPKYMRESRAPTTTFLNRKLDAVGQTWKSRTAMVDGYQWPANAHTESGNHVIAHMVTRLRAAGVSVVPVVGYDRWGNAEYRAGLQSIAPSDDGAFCLRLDSFAFEDAAEPEHFRETIEEIVRELEIDPVQCAVLLDFADVSIDAMSIEKLVETATNIIHQLEPFGFYYYVIAGCSLPKSIDLAVDTHDSVGMVLRKEMLAWQTLRLALPGVNVISGDYGVRGPTTTEAPSKYINGKIRHTIKNQIFVARGHPFITDGNQEQMHQLSTTIRRSVHYLGPRFSWGDNRILLCSRQDFLGNTTKWIAIDTNHHLTFVMQEVEEFERDVVSATDEAT